MSWVCFGKVALLGTLLVAILGGVMVRKFFLIHLLFTCIVLRCSKKIIIIIIINKKKKKKNKRKKKKEKKRKRISVTAVFGKWYCS